MLVGIGLCLLGLFAFCGLLQTPQTKSWCVSYHSVIYLTHGRYICSFVCVVVMRLCVLMTKKNIQWICPYKIIFAFQIISKISHNISTHNRHISKLKILYTTAYILWHLASAQLVLKYHGLMGTRHSDIMHLKVAYFIGVLWIYNIWNQIYHRRLSY